eukprot:GHRR01013602.1.p2 GENE.GHRR01013602.1~~GHRR01013602.1.p2  ORF type:complete len:114 (+),score=26.47 GHRR01013602.1:1161-1502(+)
MYQKAFSTNYTAIDSTGATYIAENTNIKLVGIDYLSIGILEDIVEPHITYFTKGVVVVEGLDLSEVAPGWYYQTCLPAKLTGSDGAPVRCVLQHLLQRVVTNGNKAATHNDEL